MSFDPSPIIFTFVGIIGLLVIVCGGRLFYRIHTGGAVGRVEIIRDKDGNVIAMESRL